jgi:hypothetical protein
MSTNKKIFNEATSTGDVGNFRNPLVIGTRFWEKTELEPFIDSVSKFHNPQLAYDSYDGKLNVSKKKAKEMEKQSDKMSKYIQKNNKNNDDDGNNLNGGNGPKVKTKSLNEDLGVWFGTKKKPKGSSQPKGPWVNICRKKEGGGHPPCGRPEAESKGYPKCRAAGVAAKMTDAQKRSACQQKRKAEKSNPKTGTGNKPKMVSYKPKKESVIENLIQKVLNRLIG